MAEAVVSTETVEATAPTGEAAEAVQPEGAGTESGEAGQGSNPYLDRIRSDPDYAAEQIRQKDRLVNEAKQAAKQFEGLEEYVKAAGGADGLLRYIEAGNDVLSNPQIAGIISEFKRTGQVPSVGTNQTDKEQQPDVPEWIDPDVKALIDQRESALMDRIGKLEAQLTQRLAQTDVRTYQTGIQENVGRVMDTYGRTPELKEKIGSIINRKVEAAQREAMQGSQQASDLLSRIASPEGVSTFRMMIADVLLEPETIRLLAQATESERATEVAKQSTGAPGAVATAGGGQPVQVTYGPNMVREIIAKHTKSANQTPEIWGGAD